MRWDGYVFVRLTIYLIAGILLYMYTSWQFSFLWEALVVLLIGYIIFRLKASPSLKRKSTFATGCYIFISLVLVGYQLAQSRNERVLPQHLIHQQDTVVAFQAVVVSEVVEKPNSRSFLLDLRQVQTKKGWQVASGRIQAFLSNQDSLLNPFYGDVLLVLGSPGRVAPPMNPYEFDYRAYLQQRQVYYQQFIRAGTAIKTAEERLNPFLGKALQIRQKVQAIFAVHMPFEQERGIAMALVAGIKEGLDNQVREAYASAGAMHILAVSGMHVGIVLLVLNAFLSRLRDTRQGKWIYAIAIILTLWGYAFVTGLSPSVLRAVTMFSFLTIALALGRRSSIYNSLAVSAFALLCWNPYLILEVGFQLSYTAVLGIVFLHPHLYGLFSPANRLLDWIWNLTCVSLAAQLATFPLGLYYFHQFPTYFLLSNFFVVPAAGFLVAGGLLLIFFGMALPMLASWLGWLLHWVIWLLNKIIFSIDWLPAATLSGIHLSSGEILLIYVGMISAAFVFTTRRIAWIYPAFGAVFLFFLSQIYENYQLAGQQLIAVYHVNRQPNLALVHDQQAILLADTTWLKDERQASFHTQQHFWQLGIKNYVYRGFQKGSTEVTMKDTANYTLVNWHGKTILLLKTPIPTPDFSVDYLVLTKNAVKDIAQLSDFTYGKLVVDGSNASWVVNRLAEQTASLGLEAHFTSIHGAFIAEISNQPEGLIP